MTPERLKTVCEYFEARSSGADGFSIYIRRQLFSELAEATRALQSQLAEAQRWGTQAAVEEFQAMKARADRAEAALSASEAAPAEAHNAAEEAIQAAQEIDENAFSARERMRAALEAIRSDAERGIKTTSKTSKDGVLNIISGTAYGALAAAPGKAAEESRHD